MSNKCYENGKCAYIGSLPGNAHKKCVFNWKELGGKLERIFNRWSVGFPLNFDPTWIDECSNKSDTRDPESVYTPSALEEIVAILG